MFLILNDGVRLDLDVTIDEIVKASCLASSIVIVGVGMEDFIAMNRLDSDNKLLISSAGELAKRNIVQFISESSAFDAIKLAMETLKEIFQQLDYFNANKSQLFAYMQSQEVDTNNKQKSSFNKNSI